MGIIKHKHRMGQRSKEHTAWVHMKQRCLNPNHPKFYNYGGRGIKVCERWVNSFELFLSDVGLAPSPLHSLDRYPNNNGDYEPGNVRWATNTEQQSNKRTVVLINGKSMSQISRELGGYKGLVKKRINNGWDLQKAISTPTASQSCTV